MIYLIDSDNLTALTEDNVAAWQHWADISEEDELWTCFVVVGEWEYGILHAKGRKRQLEIREKGELVFRDFAQFIDSSPEISVVYGQIAAELRRAGTMIPTNDMWSAAVARVYGATVVTHDNHFKNVKNLPVVDWMVP